MTTKQTIALRLEIERVNLLYRQNILGVVGSCMFAGAFAHFCGELMSEWVYRVWVGVIASSSITRLIFSYKWKASQHRITTLKQVQNWHFLAHSMIAVSGGIWGFAGFVGARSPDMFQQITTALTLVFMSAGAIICWTPSLKPMFTFLFPTLIPWALSYVTHENPQFHALGYLALFFVAIGSRAGIYLNRYIDRSLRLNIENAELANDLSQEIMVKDRAEEALRLALISSNAIEWRWNVEKDNFSCKGDLNRSFGVKTDFLSGTLDEIAQLVYKDDREKFRALLLQAALKGGEFEADLRVGWPDGRLHDLAFRGKAQTNPENKVTHLRGIAWDTTAQKSQAKLQQEKDIHEAANKAKSIFLANASHEIRTPLAAINGYVDALLRNSPEDSHLRADLQVISRNGRFLTALVNDFLDLSKIESGQFYFQKGLISLRHEIEESIQYIRSCNLAKELHVDLIFETEIPQTIESDPARFRQILVNLLSNAAKYTNEGFVKVIVRHHYLADREGELSIRVIDSGIGIDEKTRLQLFEPFYRGQSLDVQKVQGAGLGLALSKNLSRLLGGNLRLVRTEMNRGTEFEFTLKTQPVKQTVVPLPTQQNPKPKPLHQMKILVVDDAIDLRVLMRRNLEKLGAQVDTCENGLEAVEKALEQNFDVILMDIKMPVLDGFEATRELRKKGYAFPIIALTAHASLDDRQRVLEAGCNLYLSKPVDLTFLTDAILNTQKDRSWNSAQTLS